MDMHSANTAKVVILAYFVLENNKQIRYKIIIDIQDNNFIFFLNLLLTKGFSSVSAGAYEYVIIKQVRKVAVISKILNEKLSPAQAVPISIIPVEIRHVMLFLACMPEAKILTKLKPAKEISTYGKIAKK